MSYKLIPTTVFLPIQRGPLPGQLQASAEAGRPDLLPLESATQAIAPDW